MLKVIVLLCLIISCSESEKCDSFIQQDDLQVDSFKYKTIIEKTKNENCERPDTNINGLETIDVRYLWKNFPLMLMENVTIISEPCKTAYQQFLKGVAGYNMDDIKMLDASAKLPSGILSGNVNQYGDFDECMELSNAQYCLAEIKLDELLMGKWQKFKDPMHSYYPIREDFDDPIHRTPGFSSIRWGFCIPKECTSDDLVMSLESRLGVRAQIRENMCQMRTRKSDDSLGSTIAKSYFTAIIALVILSTIFHQKCVQSKGVAQRLITCFSIRTNFETVTTINETASNDDEFNIIHGMRALCAIGLLCSHKSMAIFFNPYINRTKMADILSLGWSIIGRNAIFYTDIFVAISAVLNANSMFNALQKSDSLKLKEKLIHRIFRIFPNFLSVILFYTYIVPKMGSGPLWPLVVDHHSDLCKKYMWRNFLFVHNFFGFGNMCLTNTHQLGMDMQLFLITPIFVWCLWRHRKIGLWLTCSCIILSSILRFWVIYQNNLTTIVYFGVSVSDLMKVADLSYTLPTHRATIYLSGILMVYFLKTTNPTPQFSMITKLIYWTIFVVLFPIVYLGPFYMAYKTYKYNRLEAALYGTISPAIVAYGVTTLVYVYKKGFAGMFGSFLAWKGWNYFNKIAYSLYLVQYQVYFFNVGKRKHAEEYSPSLIVEVPEVLTILIWSYILTLFIELPFQNIEKVLFKKGIAKEGKMMTENTTQVVRDSKRS